MSLNRHIERNITMCEQARVVQHPLHDRTHHTQMHLVHPIAPPKWFLCAAQTNFTSSASWHKVLKLHTVNFCYRHTRFRHSRIIGTNIRCTKVSTNRSYSLWANKKLRRPYNGYDAMDFVDMPDIIRAYCLAPVSRTIFSVATLGACSWLSRRTPFSERAVS